MILRLSFLNREIGILNTYEKKLRKARNKDSKTCKVDPSNEIWHAFETVSTNELKNKRDSNLFCTVCPLVVTFNRNNPSI